jgi:hypothetical protein
VQSKEERLLIHRTISATTFDTRTKLLTGGGVGVVCERRIAVVKCNKKNLKGNNQI